MYQGKFDKKRKNSSQDILEITAQRNAATASQKKAAPVQEVTAAPAAPKKRNVPYDQDEVSAKKTPVQEQPAPPKPSKKAAKEVAAAPRKKGPRLGGVIFYTLYFLFIFLFFVAVYFGLQRLLCPSSARCRNGPLRYVCRPDAGRGGLSPHRTGAGRRRHGAHPKGRRLLP